MAVNHYLVHARMRLATNRRKRRVMEEAADIAAGEQAAGSTSIRITSSEVFRGRREVVIVHHGTEYRLHITKANKLILTK
jgi:hemin uptake protein HemP